ncbi:MAG: AsmA family protein, partial [Thiotrichaceae bacterium]|nr:AsmA family protein [Thiotrichaceae bacterium]
MAKLIKFLLWTIVTFIIIIVLAAILIPIMVDPNDYKDEITQQVYQKTGRTLSIDGDINIAISLPLSVSLELGKMELSNAKGFSDTPFAKIHGASLYVAIFPLISENRLDVGEIKLSQLELNLIKNKQGLNNWSDLSAEKETAEKQTQVKSDNKTPAKSSAKNTPDNASIAEIHIAGLNIENAQITWIDEKAQQTSKLSKTNITISELIEDKPFKFKLSTDIESTNPAINGHLILESSPTVSLSKQLFQLAETTLSLDLIGKILPGGANKTHLNGDIIYNGKTQTLAIEKMNLTAYDMAISGLFNAEQLDSKIQYNGQIEIAKFSPKELAAALGAALPAMKESNALNSADAKISFNGNSDKISISDLAANLDDTSLTGNAVITNLQQPHYGFDLTLNQLNLDYYALEDVKTTAETKQKGSTKATSTKKSAPTRSAPVSSKAVTQVKSSAPIFPLETLRQLNLDGKLTIAQFIAANAKMSNVMIVLKANKGIVKLAPLKASLYQGYINLNSSIDANSNTPKLKIINQLSNVQIGDLLQDTTGKQEFTGV